MTDYHDMTPDQIARFHERHKLVLDIEFKNGAYRVMHSGTEIVSFKTLEETQKCVADNQAEHREGVQEMLEREGDLSGEDT